MPLWIVTQTSALYDQDSRNNNSIEPPSTTPAPTPTQIPQNTKAPPTPAPTPHLKLSPLPTQPPTPDTTSSPTLTPTATPTAAPTPNPTPDQSPTPTPVPTPAPSPTPNPTTKSTPTITPKPTHPPTPTAIPTPKPTPTPTPIPTPTPTPPPTPLPPPPPGYQETSLTQPIGASWIANDGTLYAGTYQTLYKSTNQGVNWQPLLTFSGDPNQTIKCVYVNRLNFIFTSPDTTATPNTLGIWRSINGGLTWARVLPLPPDFCILSMTEDNYGNLFAGVYSTGPATGGASIYKSTDFGAHWINVYNDSDARHIHCITVDKSNNYIYASVGDERITPQWHSSVIRATDGAISNSSWEVILKLPQILAIEAVTTKDANGKLIPVARLLATDHDNGEIYRTTNDENFNLVLDTGTQCYGYWIRRNDLNGDLFASFTGGEHPNEWLAGIWFSTDEGENWSTYRIFSVNYAYGGSLSASNFKQGILYYSLQLNSGLQYGVKVYPDYGGFFMQNALATPPPSGVMLSLGTIAAITIVTRKTFVLQKLKPFRITYHN